MGSPTLAFLAIIATSFFFSFVPILTKLLYSSFEPMPLGFLRFLIATIFILPFFFIQRKESLFKAIRVIWPYTILGTINILLFYLGLVRTTADSSVIIYCDVPLITAVLSYFLIKERLSKSKQIGILIGFLGTFFVVILPLLPKGIKTGDLIGNLLIVIATFMWAAYGISSKKIIEKGYSPISVATVSFIVSTVVFLIISPFVAKTNFIIPIFSINNLILLLLLGGIATVGSNVLMQWCVKHTSATITFLYQYIQPVFTIIFAAIILGEKITGGFLIGAILVLAGVFIATNKINSS